MRGRRKERSPEVRDLHDVVRSYVSELSGRDADDACHSLLELGPVALPHLVEAFRVARDAQVRLRLAQVVCYVRSIDALPFLTELLYDKDPEIWKIGLDGLVMMADEPAAVPRIREVLAVAAATADKEKRSWIDEATDQIQSPTRPAEQQLD